jgi:hypothetical protein
MRFTWNLNCKANYDYHIGNHRWRLLSQLTLPIMVSRIGAIRGLFFRNLALGSSAVSWSQISLDGSLGPSGPLAGPNFQINSALGRQVGANLFLVFGIPFEGWRGGNFLGT